jgi:hypothetical protein
MSAEGCMVRCLPVTVEAPIELLRLDTWFEYYI